MPSPLWHARGKISVPRQKQKSLPRYGKAFLNIFKMRELQAVQGKAFRHGISHGLREFFSRHGGFLVF